MHVQCHVSSLFVHVDLVFLSLFFCACCLSFFPFQRLEFVSFLETFSKSNFVESVTHTHFGRVMGMERRERGEGQRERKRESEERHRGAVVVDYSLVSGMHES